MKTAAVIVAAGAGLRAGGEVPKQWRDLAGKSVVRWAAEGLLAAGASPVVVVVPAGDEEAAAQRLANLPIILIAGGADRTASVRAGLDALADDAPDYVLVHDAARPFVNSAHVAPLLAALEAGADGALPAFAVADTLKRQDETGVSTVSRDGLHRAQTPQAFRYPKLVAAYEGWSGLATDDAAVVEAAGGLIRLTPGDPLLMKLTYPEDFPMAERLAGAARITRTGFGLDAHRFGPGDAVWLCGVRIEHDAGLIGHSDADAGLHALTDAILGAIGEGDIGDHFPPTDPQWKGAPSDLFLRHAADLVHAKGGRIINVDVTLVCERPKIKPHREAMRARLAEILGLSIDRVSVKATTTEKMGFTGREEGLAAQAVASVETPA